MVGTGIRHAGDVARRQKIRCTNWQKECSRSNHWTGNRVTARFSVSELWLEFLWELACFLKLSARKRYYGLMGVGKVCKCAQKTVLAVTPRIYKGGQHERTRSYRISFQGPAPATRFTLDKLPNVKTLSWRTIFATYTVEGWHLLVRFVIDCPLLTP